MLRVAAEIDGDVDLEAARQRRNLLIRLPEDRHEVVEGRLHPRAQPVAGIRAQREGGELEAGAVVRLEELCGERGNGVIAEIGGEVADTHLFVMRMRLQWRRRGARRATLLARPDGRRAALEGRRVEQRQYPERTDRRSSALDRDGQRRPLRLELSPVADVHAGVLA